MTLGARLGSHFSVSGRMSGHEYRRLMLRLIYLSAAVMVAGIFLASLGVRFAGYAAVAMIAAIWLVNGAAFVRRFHDRNRTGWWLLFAILTFFLALYFEGLDKAKGIGPTGVLLFQLAVIVVNLWLIVELHVLKGTAGPNRFGSDPLDEEL